MGFAQIKPTTAARQIHMIKGILDVIKQKIGGHAKSKRAPAPVSAKLQASFAKRFARLIRIVLSARAAANIQKTVHIERQSQPPSLAVAIRPLGFLLRGRRLPQAGRKRGFVASAVATVLVFFRRPLPRSVPQPRRQRGFPILSPCEVRNRQNCNQQKNAAAHHSFSH